MTAELILDGRFSWEGERDDEGHRTFKVGHRIKTTDTEDGPFVVMNCPGLPAIGSVWNFGNDLDSWAFCYPQMKVSFYQQKPGYPHKHWLVEQKFSTKPLNRCQDATIEDPLLEPMKISGSFVKYTKEVVQDRFGAYIKSSSHELIRGKNVEFDHNRPQVNISQNVPSLQLETFSAMIDTVNDATLWGLPARTIKLSEASWERKVYGTCFYYYTRNFGFDIDFNGWDRVLLDEGTKALNGRWNVSTGDWELVNIGGSAPDPNNPKHFCVYTDVNGNPCRAVLNGAGLPADLDSGTGSSVDPGQIEVEYYGESNFLTLVIPTTL